MALVSWVIEGIAYAEFALARSMLGIYGGPSPTPLCVSLSCVGIPID